MDGLRGHALVPGAGAHLQVQTMLVVVVLLLLLLLLLPLVVVLLLLLLLLLTLPLLPAATIRSTPPALTSGPWAASLRSSSGASRCSQATMSTTSSTS